jgi:phospholipid/cholesterol/gamma-HCH transport system substrate-binding protein
VVNERALRFRIGLFVLVALVLLGTLVVMFGSLPSLFRPSNLYTVRFVDAPGLGPGAPVRRSGVKIGQVRDLILDDERGIVRVQVAIDPRYTIRRNEQATLAIGLLGTDASIDFVPLPAEAGQPADREPIPPGGEMVGVRQANVNTLLNRASEVVPTTQETLNDIRKSMQRMEQSLNRLTPLAEETLKVYRDLGRSAQDMMPDLRRTNTEYQELAREARRGIADARKTNDDIGATARTWGRLGERLDVLLQGNQDKLVKAVDNLNDVLTRTSNLLSEENQRNVNLTLRNTSRASNSFPDIARNTEDISKEGRTTVRRLNDSLVRVDEVLSNLQTTTKPLSQRAESISRNLDETLAKLNRTLTDLGLLMRVVDQNDSLLRRVLSDPSLYAHTDELVCSLLRMTPRLNQILKDFEVFSDKMARHPEVIGVGGAVRPSSGLKGPLTPPGAYSQPPGMVVPPPGH